MSKLVMSVRGSGINAALANGQSTGLASSSVPPPPPPRRHAAPALAHALQPKAPHPPPPRAPPAAARRCWPRRWRAWWACPLPWRTPPASPRRAMWGMTWSLSSSSCCRWGREWGGPGASAKGLAVSQFCALAHAIRTPPGPNPAQTSPTQPNPAQTNPTHPTPSHPTPPAPTRPHPTPPHPTPPPVRQFQCGGGGVRHRIHRRDRQAGRQGRRRWW
jgi:hypothetical protein